MSAVEILAELPKLTDDERAELAPRDIVSRSEMTEIQEGRGFEGPDGLDYIQLDLTHLGAERINKSILFHYIESQKI